MFLRFLSVIIVAAMVIGMGNLLTAPAAPAAPEQAAVVPPVVVPGVDQDCAICPDTTCPENPAYQETERRVAGKIVGAVVKPVKIVGKVAKPLKVMGKLRPHIFGRRHCR